MKKFLVSIISISILSTIAFITIKKIDKKPKYVHYRKFLRNIDVNQYTRNYKLVKKQSLTKSRYKEKEHKFFLNLSNKCPEFLTNVLHHFEKEKFPDNKNHQEKYKVNKKDLKDELFCYQQMNIAKRNIPLKYIHKDLN